LGAQRTDFIAQYPFRIEATTDDCPYFFHFFRWRSLPLLRQSLGQRARTYLEAGYLMLVAGAAQAAVLSVLLIVVPVLPGIGVLRRARHKGAAFCYFLLIGVGFMFLEMGFLQKFILYLASPLYAAAVAIASFLLFGGLGSMWSVRWSGAPEKMGAVAGAVVALLALVYLLVSEAWLSLSQGAPVWVRFLIAAGTIAPLAFAMGHLMPAGLAALSRCETNGEPTAMSARGTLVPWAWAINGCASVCATAGAPLLAMHAGFSWLIAIAALCYAAAGSTALLLPISRRCSKG